MEDKKTILNALEELGTILLPKPHCVILKILISLEVEGVVKIHTSELISKSGYTKQLVYPCLNNLEQQKYIETKTSSDHQKIITLNYIKIEEIIPHYKAYEKYCKSELGEKKMLMLKLIKESEILPLNDFNVLSVLYSLEYNGVVLVTVPRLKKLLGIHDPQKIYQSLKVLKEKNFILTKSKKTVTLNLTIFTEIAPSSSLVL